MRISHLLLEPSVTSECQLTAYLLLKIEKETLSEKITVESGI
jgi:hypothetical protein